MFFPTSSDKVFEYLVGVLSICFLIFSLAFIIFLNIIYIKNTIFIMTQTIIKYLNYSPYLDEIVNIGNNSVIIGNTFVGKSILDDNVVIRGDGKEYTLEKIVFLKIDLQFM